MDALELDEILTVRRNTFHARPKSKIKIGPENSVQSSVQLDYSDTYRENDALDCDLEDHLDGLKKDQKRQLLEKGEQLKEIRKQVEVITRLQELVNSRKPGSSANLVASRSSRGSIQYGTATGGRGLGLAQRRKSRTSVGSNSNNNTINGDGGDTKKTGAPEVDVDFGTLAQATRTQMRIAAEREKFSAKNLFNRPKTALGTYGGGDGAAQRRFFAGPSATVNSGADLDHRESLLDREGEGYDDDEVDYHSNAIIAVQIRNNGKNNVDSRSSVTSNGHALNGHSHNGKTNDEDVLFHRPASRNSHQQHPYNNHHQQQQQQQHHQPSAAKGIIRPATATSRGGVRPPSTSSFATNTITNGNTAPNNNNNNTKKLRPKTAVGFVTPFGQDGDNQADDGVLPPRSKSRNARSRSRRQLELLCRVLRPEEEEAAVAVAGDAADQWEMINTQRRRRKLLDLRRDGARLETKVKDFLDDIQGFNKRRSVSSSSAQRRPSSAGYALMREDWK